MKRMIAVFFGAVLFAPLLLAQPEHGRRASRTFLTDDDDGKVEAWRHGDGTSPIVTDATIRQPLLQVVFAGPWGEEAKAAILNGLGRIAMPSGVQPAAMIGSRDLPSEGAVNDLAIQSMLNRAMADGKLASRQENVIHIVFLARGVQSTLGASRAGADYDSYHSHLHIHDTNVRYVVVPWIDDPERLLGAAANSTLRAVLNPD
jgi:hypothetical protein